VVVFCFDPGLVNVPLQLSLQHPPLVKVEMTNWSIIGRQRQPRDQTNMMVLGALAIKKSKKQSVSSHSTHVWIHPLCHGSGHCRLHLLPEAQSVLFTLCRKHGRQGEFHPTQLSFVSAGVCHNTTTRSTRCLGPF